MEVLVPFWVCRADAELTYNQPLRKAKRYTCLLLVALIQLDASETPLSDILLLFFRPVTSFFVQAFS